MTSYSLIFFNSMYFVVESLKKPVFPPPCIKLRYSRVFLRTNKYHQCLSKYFYLNRKQAVVACIDNSMHMNQKTQTFTHISLCTTQWCHNVQCQPLFIDFLTTCPGFRKGNQKNEYFFGQTLTNRVNDAVNLHLSDFSHTQHTDESQLGRKWRFTIVTG